MARYPAPCQKRRAEAGVLDAPGSVDEVHGEARLSVQCKVQREVVGALLAERFGVRTRFLHTMTICMERVVGTGAVPVS